MFPHRCRPRVELLEARELPAVIPGLPASPFSQAGQSRSAPQPVPEQPAHLVYPSFTGAVGLRTRAIFQLGQSLGNRSDVLMKLGDSNTANGSFLVPFGSPGYDPRDTRYGLSASMIDTVDFYRQTRVDGFGANSFNRNSSAARPGWTIDQVLSSFDGETRAIRPSVAVIMIGTNDVGYRDPAGFRHKLTTLVQQLSIRGVVPIVSTIPDRLLGGSAYQADVLRYNQVIREVATAQQVPLLDYWRAMQSVPNRGLSGDQVHPSVDPRGAGVLTPGGLQSGFNMRNLVTLNTLSAFREAVGV